MSGFTGSLDRRSDGRGLAKALREDPQPCEGLASLTTVAVYLSIVEASLDLVTALRFQGLGDDQRTLAPVRRRINLERHGPAGMTSFTILLVIYFSGASLLDAAGLDELTDSKILRGMNGFPVEGYSSQALEAELRSERAGAFIERCKAHEELRKMMVGFPRMVADPDLREEIIAYILREDSIWEDDQRMSQALIMRANAFAYPALANEFAMAGDPENASLALCLLSVGGRERLSQLHARLMRIERTERSPEDPRVIEIIDSVGEVVATYGTDEYLRKGGGRESGSQGLPERRPVREEKADRAKQAGWPAGVAGSDPSPPAHQSRLIWIGAVIVVVVASGLIVVRRRIIN